MKRHQSFQQPPAIRRKVMVDEKTRAPRPNSASLYAASLRSSGGFAALPGGVFALSDLVDLSSLALHSSRWQVVWPSLSSTLLCSCPASSSIRQLTAESDVTRGASALEPCIHVQASRFLVAHPDDLPDSPQLVVDFCQEPMRAAVRTVLGDWAVVGLAQQHLHCLSCGKRHCLHSSAFRECMDSAGVDWHQASSVSEEDSEPAGQPPPSEPVPFPFLQSSLSFPETSYPPDSKLLAYDSNGLQRPVSSQEGAAEGFLRVSQRLLVHHSLLVRYSNHTHL
jgi:hypothetical protein